MYTPHQQQVTEEVKGGQTVNPEDIPVYEEDAEVQAVAPNFRINNGGQQQQ